MLKKISLFAPLIASLAFAACKEEYGLERSIVIKAPVGVVFENVNNLKKNEAWAPWGLEDKTMKITYNDIAAGVGASSSWTSEDSGEGTQTITESVANKRILTELDFKKEGKAAAEWAFEETPEGVKVTWYFRGKAGGLGDRIFGMFIDTFLGKYYEQGLAKLKEVSEH